MEKEIEFKLLNLDIYYYMKLLEKKGGKLIAHELQKNTVVDSTSLPLIEAKSYLRIREVKDLLKGNDKKELTFKKNIANKYARENLEYTTEFSNKDNLMKILENLQLDKYTSGTKERYSYCYRNIRIDFDIWDKDIYPYPYIELEGENEEDLYELLKELNIDKKHISLKSITELQDELKS